MAERLQKLEDRLEQPLIERLGSDESFTTVLLSASQIAVRNHQREKLEALKNAVLNSALGVTPDETKRAIFLSLVDRLTPTHIVLLKFFRAPLDNTAAQPFRDHSMGGLFHLISTVFPELRSQKELLELIWQDLSNSGLLSGGGMNVTMTGSGLVQKRTTELGDQFLRFIADPQT